MSDTRHVKGLDQVDRALATLAPKLQKNVMRGALRAGMAVIKPEAQKNIHSVSGELAAGLKIGTKTKGAQVIANLKATGPHAFIGHLLEFTGASAHVIMPSVKKALRIGGAAVASVDHPGFGPKKFMRPAMDAKAGPAVVAVGTYIKRRISVKNGIDTADIVIEEAE